MTRPSLALPPAPSLPAAERPGYLAAVGELLATSLDEHETQRLIARLAVPRVADWCAVDLLDDGAIRRLALARDDGASEGVGHELAERYAPRSASPAAAAAMLREARPLLWSRVPEVVLEQLAWNEEHLELLRALGETSAIVVPLVTRGRTVGAITWVAGASRPPYENDDLEFARRLAARAAVYADNARLYHEAQRAIRARETSLSIVSHDLRNPLSAIVIGAHLLRDPGLGGAEWGRQIEVILRSAEQMNRLIEDLLDVASLDAGRALALDRRVEPVAPIVAEIAELFASAAAAKGIELETEVAESLPEVPLDRHRVLQVLSNLVGNAIQYTPAGGRVAVRAAPASPPAPIPAKASKAPAVPRAHPVEAVHFEVEDNGPGISAVEREHLFERWWRGDRGARAGTGLGLPIARGIVENHGGRIWLECEPGEGCVFHFTLPASGRVPAAGAPAA